MNSKSYDWSKELRGVLGNRFAISPFHCFSIARLAVFLFTISLFHHFTASPVYADVVINEIFYDPDGSDAGCEWVELYNNGASAVNLSGWFLQADVNGVWTTTTSAVSAVLTGSIASRGYYLVADSTYATSAVEDQVLVTGTMGMSNASSKSEGVRLVNAALVEMDRLVYGTPDADGIGAEGGSGNEAGKVASDSSLARRVDGEDTNVNRIDFMEDTTPTPGTGNDPAGFVRADVEKTISYPNPFAPARHGTVKISTPQFLATTLTAIRIYNMAGELVRTLQEPQWDGKNDDGDPVSTGLYFYVIETGLGKARGKITVVR